MFSAKEIEYINSIKVSVVSDPEFIKTFAHDLSRGTNSDWDWPSGAMEAFGIKFTCWRGSERVASFTAFEDLLLTDDGHCFRYETAFPDVTIFQPREIVPFQLRYACAHSLSHIWIFLRLIKTTPYPDPNNWCDAVRDAFQNRCVTSGGKKRRLYSDAWIAETLTCPSLRSSIDSHGPNRARAAALDGRTVDVWRSDYAMNSNCRRTSPPDTVFLFETKPGWNQHGGPELFAFGNHEPKGGCVLLNDSLGTTKFIRTEEELQQLRWK